MKLNSTATSRILFIALSSLLLFLSVSLCQASSLAIKGDRVNLRSGPGKNYSIIWVYGTGFPVEVIKNKGKWLKVRDFEKDVGWVHQSLLAKKKQVIVKANKNFKNKINIRSGPGTKYDIIGRAFYGVVFRVLEQRKGGWVKVRHSSGLTGWIKDTLLWGL